MKLVNAMRTNDTKTTNGMLAHSTTLNDCVDLFSTIGSLRNVDKETKINALVKSLNDDALTTMKILFWARDVRGGAGERGTFIDLFIYLADNHTDLVKKNLHLVSEFGRWSDLFPLLDTKVSNDVLSLIKEGLEAKNGLLAKWLPRINTNNSDKKRWSKMVMKSLGLSRGDYRRLLSKLSNTVEQSMCAGNWDSIEYSKIPSKAMSDNMRTFGKHDYDRFNKYLESVNNGEVKINTGAVYPYDILKNLKNGDSNGASTQWSALPNYMDGNNERVLPLVDVSYSMGCSAGGSSSITCLDVAISLGLYISERNEGPFKDAFLTFESRPKLEVLKGNLSERYMQLRDSDWGGSTNIEAAYEMILNSAVKNNVSKDEMPTTMLVLSDMQFNQADNSDFNAHDLATNLFNEHGYEVPKLVYWNLNASNGNHPVQSDESGACLVSGFNVNILTKLLGGKDISPLSMMLDTINSQRYESITI